MPRHWRDIPDTGDVVKNDQTVTMRVYHARRKVRGKMSSQCSGGCGAYLTDEEKEDHKCPGPPQTLPRRRPSFIVFPKSLRKRKKQKPIPSFGVGPRWKKGSLAKMKRIVAGTPPAPLRDKTSVANARKALGL